MKKQKTCFRAKPRKCLWCTMQFRHPKFLKSKNKSFGNCVADVMTYFRFHDLTNLLVRPLTTEGPPTMKRSQLYRAGTPVLCYLVSNTVRTSAIPTISGRVSNSLQDSISIMTWGGGGPRALKKRKHLLLCIYIYIYLYVRWSLLYNVVLFIVIVV